MMGIYELHAEQQQPLGAELYTFTIDGAPYRYTSYEQSVDYDGATFIREAIQRSGYNRRVSGRSITISIKVPSNLPFVAMLNQLTYETAEISVDKIFLEHKEFIYKIFRGSLTGVKIRKGVCEISCASFFNVFDSSTPKIFVQSYCNNTLGDDFCRAQLQFYELTVRVVNAVDPWGEVKYPMDGYFHVEDHGVDSFGNHYSDRPEHFFQQGECTIDGEKRYISDSINHDWGGGAQLRVIHLHYPLSSTPTAGDVVTLRPGCNKSPSDCVDKFNNLENFVGFPYIPSVDPYKWGIRKL